MKQHSLKCDPIPFTATWKGLKDFELLFNDRHFLVEDWVEILETKYSAQEMINGKPLLYTGRAISRQVSYVLQHVQGLDYEYVILSFRHCGA